MLRIDLRSFATRNSTADMWGRYGGRGQRSALASRVSLRKTPWMDARVTAGVRTVTTDCARFGPAVYLPISTKSPGYGLGVPRPLPRGAVYSWGHRRGESGGEIVPQIRIFSFCMQTSLLVVAGNQS
jgi:hypothetical protein